MHMQAGHGSAEQCAACCLRAATSQLCVVLALSACGHELVQAQPVSLDKPTRRCTCMQSELPHTSSKDVRSMWGFCLRLDGVRLSTTRRATGQIRGGDSTPGMSNSAYSARSMHSLQKMICKSTHIRASGLRWGPRDLPCCVYTHFRDSQPLEQSNY